MSSQPKDDKNAIGSISKKELALLVVGISFGIFLVSASATLVIAMLNSGDKISIVGEWDLQRVQDFFYLILGAGIVYIGISQGAKLSK